MNLTKNQIVIIASLVVVVVAYFMFFRKKKVTTTTKAMAPAKSPESSWAPEYTSDASALLSAQGGWAGMYSNLESGYDGIPAFVNPQEGGNWLGY